jgi:hypothetical protein|tara:strand:+ start:1204 stop:1428 length:225 start_codon:yes stop_codon:yes gene_type:complete
MSLFLRVKTRSQLLGKKEYDTTLIAVDRIHKIESFGESGGCVITHGNPPERLTCDREMSPLLASSVIDLKFKAK